MNFFITLYLLASVSVMASGIMDRNRITNSKKVEIDFENECGSRPCLVKCCGVNEVMYKKKGQPIQKCVNLMELAKHLNYSTLTPKPTDYSDLKFFTADQNISSITVKDFQIVYRKDFNSLDPEQTYLKYSKSYAKLTENGEVKVGPLTQSVPQFCFEKLIGKNKKGNVLQNIFYYINYDDNSQTIAESTFISYGALVSAFFILLVLVVYGLLKQLRNNLHGMLLMVFMASLMALTVLQSSTTLYEYKLIYEGKDREKYTVCKWLCPIIYFLLLSTFFWMNTMCFDIWWTFRGTRKVREIHRRGIYVKFMTYALYAWGLPLLVTIIAVVIDRSDLPKSVSKPGFETCFHDTEDQMVRMYKYLPMLVLVMSNIVLYAMTIYNIWMVRRNMTTVDSTQTKKNKNHFIVYLKLSVIMGMSWLFELIQVLFKTLPLWLFYALNTFNLFLGVVIFFILVFKRSIFIMLCQRFGFENRWTRKSTNIKASTRTDCSKSSKSYARTKTTDDSIEFESMTLSNADTMKANGQQLQNPRFTITKV